jgi:hypothetical protein
VLLKECFRSSSMNPDLRKDSRTYEIQERVGTDVISDAVAKPGHIGSLFVLACLGPPN